MNEISPFRGWGPTSGWALALGVVAALCAVFAVHGWYRRSRPGGVQFVTVMAAAAVWALFYCFELMAPGLEGKVFWAKLEYLGIAILPLVWLLFALDHTGARRPSARAIALLGIEPVATILLVASNELHHLVWSDVSLRENTFGSVLAIEHGAWFWLNMFYSYVLLVMGSVLLIRAAHGYPRPYRLQAAMIMLAAIVPWLGNAVSVLLLMPRGYIDVTPLGFLITAFALFLAGSRFRLFNLLPALLPRARSQVLQNMTDGVIVLDIDERVVNCNPAALRLLAHRTSSPVGQDVSEIFGDAVPDPVGTKRDEEWRFEVVLDHDGSKRYFDVASTPLHLQGGGGMGRLLVLRDMSERKRMEQELVESEERFRALFQNSSDLIVVFDAEGAIQLASPSCRRGIGYEPDELKGRRFQNLLHPEDATRAAEAFAALRRPGEDFGQPCEVRARHKDGSWRTLELVGRRLEMATGEAVYMGSGRDITERKHAEEILKQREEQYRQAQKMEAIGRLAGGMAHDFNNMLTAIIGNTTLLLAAMGSEDNNRDLVADIKAVGERAAALTSQVLAFSRRQILRPESLRLNGILTNMEALLRRTLGEDIHVEFVLSPDLHRTEVDRHQVEQVIMNLAVNARDAMPDGGLLRFETANVELGHAGVVVDGQVDPGRYVALAVTDTGCGMDEETKSHVFEPFFTTKEPGKGTGLGLSSVLGFVQQSGGTVSVDSELGMGTTFTIYVPVGAADATGAMLKPPEAAPEAGTETILVVEDEDPVRKMIVRVLSGSGYEVLQARSIHDVDALLERNQERPDLLLTDVVLPGGSSGRDVAEMLRARHPGLRVLFMSGYTRDSVVRNGRLEEGIEFLGKPFTSEDLLGRVRAVLETKPAES